MWKAWTKTLDVLEAIKGRRSIRDFLDKEVTQNDLEVIIRCGISAPSAGNLQPWEFVVVRELSRKKAISEAALYQDFISKAPVVLVVLANQARSARVYGRRGAELYSIQDTAAATQNMLLAIYSMGLGACWIGAFDEKAVAEIVGAPDHIRPMGIIPIGYPSHSPAATSRRKASDVTHKEVYQT